MSRRGFGANRRLAPHAVAVLAAMLVAGATLPVPSAIAETNQACVIIDTDLDYDDLMAIAPVIQRRDVRAIVTTEGVTRPGSAASALRTFLRRGDVSPRPAVIVGAPAVSPVGFEEPPWLPTIRRAMERLNNWLDRPLPASRAEVKAGQTGAFAQQVVDAVAGCSSIDILVIGPFASFDVYAPLLAGRIGEVVMQGKPLRGDPTAEPGDVSFNCKYDLPSCRTAFTLLKKQHATWVDLARGVDPPYEPSLGMVLRLKKTGLPGALRRALLADQHTWNPERLSVDNKSLLWDQLTALYLLQPSAFTTVGGHVETNWSPQESRNAWVKATNS